MKKVKVTATPILWLLLLLLTMVATPLNNRTLEKPIPQNRFTKIVTAKKLIIAGQGTDLPIKITTRKISVSGLEYFIPKKFITRKLTITGQGSGLPIQITSRKISVSGLEYFIPKKITTRKLTVTGQDGRKLN